MRAVIAVDVESSGLRASVHDAIEVSWWNLSTGEKATFIPAHDSGNVCTYGQEAALQLNGYRERIAGGPAPLHGPYLADQSLHHVCVALAAAVIAWRRP